ncbi:MAG: hypothetical protein QGI68_12970 [Pseudomonadales bacterium]|nr:hypothetical protein [Pseudomonadales bacterium]MDP7596465.1 hypothetical protein [Pseudomonadales bacterium]HJN52841.1 hypothetical protein [Pseudomonadales bacterium]
MLLRPRFPPAQRLLGIRKLFITPVIALLVDQASGLSWSLPNKRTRVSRIPKRIQKGIPRFRLTLEGLCLLEQVTRCIKITSLVECVGMLGRAPCHLSNSIPHRSADVTDFSASATEMPT